MTERRCEEPQEVFAQPELPLGGIEALDAMARVELWLRSHENDDYDLGVVSAHLYLTDSDTRMQRARRWARVFQIHERSTHEWGLLLHGGTETVLLLDDAAHALADGLWLASLLCSHAACERHLAGLLSFNEDSLPNSWRGWGLGRLLQAAQERDIVPSDLWESLNSLNEVRKVSAHFKPPLEPGSLTSRALASDHMDFLESTESLAEADAFAAYETARSLVHRARVR